MSSIANRAAYSLEVPRPYFDIVHTANLHLFKARTSCLCLCTGSNTFQLYAGKPLQNPFHAVAPGAAEGNGAEQHIIE